MARKEFLNGKTGTKPSRVEEICWILIAYIPNRIYYMLLPDLQLGTNWNVRIDLLLNLWHYDKEQQTFVPLSVGEAVPGFSAERHVHILGKVSWTWAFSEVMIVSLEGNVMFDCLQEQKHTLWLTVVIGGALSFREKSKWTSLGWASESFPMTSKNSKTVMWKMPKLKALLKWPHAKTTACWSLTQKCCYFCVGCFTQGWAEEWLIYWKYLDQETCLEVMWYGGGIIFITG